MSHRRLGFPLIGFADAIRTRQTGLRTSRVRVDLPAIPTVPITPVHQPDKMVLAIEALRDRAKSDGHLTLASLLGIAARRPIRYSGRHA